MSEKIPTTTVAAELPGVSVRAASAYCGHSSSTNVLEHIANPDVRGSSARLELPTQSFSHRSSDRNHLHALVWPEGRSIKARSTTGPAAQTGASGRRWC